MDRRVSFSDQHLELDEISSHHSDSENSRRLYFRSENEERFASYTTADLAKELRVRTDELGRTSSLSLLAALEAVFRIDYLQRNYKKKKDALSRKFQSIYKAKSTRVSLEDDILRCLEGKYAWHIPVDRRFERGLQISQLAGSRTLLAT